MSRRKPNITRKRVGESDEEGDMMEDEYRENDSEEAEDEGVEGRHESQDKEEESDDMDLPEGTVVVHPEGVDEKRQYDVEMSASKQSLGLLSSPIQCTACHGYIPVVRRDSVRSHPVLGVLVCRKCYITHTTMEIEPGEDGLDDSCRWCAEGGDLICCDYCHHAFCKICIRRNMGRTALNDILSADDDAKWKCYVCDSAPLKKLIDTCAKVLAETASLPQSSPNNPGGVKRTPKVKKDVAAVKPAQSPVEAEEEEQEEEEEEEEEPPAKTSQFSAAAHLVAAREIASGRGKPRGGSLTKMRSVKSRGAESVHQQDNVVYIRTPTGSIVGIPAKRLTEEIKQAEPVATAVAVTLVLNIDENNVWNILEKLLAATQSMGMLLSSLKDDLRRTGNGWSEGNPTPASVEHARKKREVATKLWRAFVAYKKSFQDIETFSRSSGPPAAKSISGAAKEPGANGSARQVTSELNTARSSSQSESMGEVKQAAIIVNKKREAETDDQSIIKRAKLSEGVDSQEAVGHEPQGHIFEHMQFEPLFKIDEPK